MVGRALELDGAQQAGHRSGSDQRRTSAEQAGGVADDVGEQPPARSCRGSRAKADCTRTPTPGIAATRGSSGALSCCHPRPEPAPAPGSSPRARRRDPQGSVPPGGDSGQAASAPPTRLEIGARRWALAVTSTAPFPARHRRGILAGEASCRSAASRVKAREGRCRRGRGEDKGLCRHRRQGSGDQAGAAMVQRGVQAPVALDGAQRLGGGADGGGRNLPAVGPDIESPGSMGRRIGEGPAARASGDAPAGAREFLGEFAASIPRRPDRRRE